jgi:hypothetical protein
MTERANVHPGRVVFARMHSGPIGGPPTIRSYELARAGAAAMQRLSGIRNASPMFMRQLVYLVALDRHRHFARAAEACHVSQPALSAGLAELERELGITIIKRNRSFQGITPEGERVLAWAHQVLASGWPEARGRAGAAGGGRSCFDRHDPLGGGAAQCSGQHLSRQLSRPDA